MKGRRRAVKKLPAKGRKGARRGKSGSTPEGDPAARGDGKNPEKENGKANEAADIGTETGACVQPRKKKATGVAAVAPEVRPPCGE